MESRENDTTPSAPIHPSARDAAEQLQRADTLREHVESSGPSRRYSMLQLWSAVLTSAYIFVFLLSTIALRTLPEASPTSSLVVLMILLPVISFGALLRGAAERFSVRRTRSPGERVAYSGLVVVFFALLVVNLLGGSYPWWFSALAAAAAFAVLGYVPLRQLRQAQPRDAAPWVSLPLSRPARTLTALYGLAIGGTVASSGYPLLFFPLIMVTMFGFLLTSTPNARRLSLPSTGFEWGPLHWAAFGITSTVVFSVIPVMAFTTLFTTPLAVTTGAVIALIMAAAAFLPLRRHSVEA